MPGPSGLRFTVSFGLRVLFVLFLFAVLFHPYMGVKRYVALSP